MTCSSDPTWEPPPRYHIPSFLVEAHESFSDAGVLRQVPEASAHAAVLMSEVRAASGYHLGGATRPVPVD